jgi:O-antigen/teichoic acid export membrane protein
MSPFASCGTGDVLIKHAARNRSLLRVYFGNALLVTVAFGSLLTLFALLIRHLVLPASATTTMLVAVAIADLVAGQIVEVCLHAFAAVEQFSRYTKLMVFSTGLRLLAAPLLLAFRNKPMGWAYLYAASAVLAAISGLAAVSRYCAPPKFQLDLLVPSVNEGFHFATSVASQSVYTDTDKTMLARLTSVESAAVYAVAYRFVDAAMLPIRSLAAATYPEFFRQGLQGVTPAFGFARRILRGSVVYGIVTSLALFLVAGIVPLIMGSAFAESAAALRWLCPLPLIKSINSFLTDTLTGANYQWERSSAQFAVAGFNVIINFWLIRAFAWRGAAWSSLMTDSLLAVLLYMIIRWHLRRENAARGTTAPQAALAVGGE